MTTYVIAAATGDKSLAQSIAGLIQEAIEPPPGALSLFETRPGTWRVEAYYENEPDATAIGDVLAAALGNNLPAIETGTVAEKNWVAISQAALPPVHAGRFTIFGSHDKARIATGPNAILIEAGEAFGTAHHATTYGCLLALDELTRRRSFRSILDLGCGSGVLAIALARALPRAQITASDLDHRSIEVAAENMRVNGVGHRITTLVARGLAAPGLRTPRAFDLVVANILAGPLAELAPGIGTALAPGGTLVLSGILVPQSPAVIAAYRAQGFALATHKRIAGWSTLVLLKR